MKVKQLIAKLQKFDPAMPVVYFGMDGDWEQVSGAVKAKEWTPATVILRGRTVREHLEKYIERERGR